MMVSMGVGTLVRFTDFAMVGDLGPGALAAVGAFMLIGGAALGLLPLGIAAFAAATVASSFRDRTPPPPPVAGYRRSLFGGFIALLTKNAIGPFVALGLAVFGVMTVFQLYGESNKGAVPV